MDVRVELSIRCARCGGLVEISPKTGQWQHKVVPKKRHKVIVEYHKKYVGIPKGV